MVRIVIVALAAVLLAAPAHAADRPPEANRAEAARLLDAAHMFGADQSFRAAPRISARGHRYPDDFPAEAVAAIAEKEAKLREKADGPFRETLIDVFASKLSLDQLRAAADFMQSPAGQARGRMIQRQNAEPALSYNRVFTQDKELRAAVATEAKARGIVLPE